MTSHSRASDNWLKRKGALLRPIGAGVIKIISIGRVIPITDLAVVVEGAGVLAAFGTTVEIMAHSSSGGSWPKGRKGAAMRKMVPTPTNRARRFRLTSTL